MVGMCGKQPSTSNLQDLLIHAVIGVAYYADQLSNVAELSNEAGAFVMRALFATITNANFDDARIIGYIQEADEMRARLAQQCTEQGVSTPPNSVPNAATVSLADPEAYADRVGDFGFLATEDVDLKSLRETIVYGLKGVAAYADHATVLGYEDNEIYRDTFRLLAACTEEHSAEDMTALVLKTGDVAVRTMALLDKAHTTTYGNPEITTVNIGVKAKPGILVSGHDLRDLQELLEQTEGTGVDIYTHCEMLPAHYYPAFKKYSHFIGNYGGSWWRQDKEFASFNGPILMTTNCITPVKDAYRDRIFTTGQAGYPDVPHIADRSAAGPKDFSQVIERARSCEAPQEIETGEIVGGFAHAQVGALADKVVDAVKSGAIKRFVVMAGCDGRQRGREYFTGVAEQLPEDTVILTAGCAKYRYNKLQLGDIGGIPRVLDAGQCNDSYSLVVTALKLKEAFGLTDINELPISYDLAWYEQKAVCVLLALLSLGVRDIRLGPTLPAFLSPGVAQVITDTFNLQPIGEPAADVAAMLA
ncbi:MAG: hydroxylamine reductase [Spirochaeta sp.]|nr:hydroxylamine reductase [Spirochaeta sp.]